MKMGRIIKNN